MVTAQSTHEEVLKAKATQLEKTWLHICARSASIRGLVFVGTDSASGQQAIILNAWYCYDEKKHPGREYELITKSCRYLLALNMQEVMAIRYAVIQLAGGRFDTQLTRFDRGIYTYRLVPRPSAKE